MLCYGRKIPLSELNARIDLLTPQQIRDVIHHYAIDSSQIEPVVVGVGPVADMMSADDARHLLTKL